MRVTRIFAAVALGLAGNLALAADPDQAIRSSLKAIDPDMQIEAIAESPLNGIYEVHLPVAACCIPALTASTCCKAFSISSKMARR